MRSATCAPSPVCPRLRWYQFSLLSLVVVATICSILCSWFAARLAAARRQRAAMVALSELDGAWIWYDCHYDVGCAPVDVELRGPQWLRGLLGDDFFNHVARVNVSSTVADDATLHHLMAFPKLRSLLLVNTRVTDAGIARLEGLQSLEHLNLQGVTITDSSLVRLSALEKLRWLFLGDTGVTDEGVGYLSRLKALEGLDLSSTSITDRGLSHLRHIPHLRDLGLIDTAVTDEGLEQLACHKDLKTLWLPSPETALITDDGIAKLQQALPDCDISR